MVLFHAGWPCGLHSFVGSHPAEMGIRDLTHPFPRQTEPQKGAVPTRGETGTGLPQFLGTVDTAEKAEILWLQPIPPKTTPKFLGR